MTSSQHSCATCAAPITVTSRNPNKRYCSPRCRVADWHRHHNQARHDDDAHDVPNVVPQPSTTFANAANVVPNGVNAANGDQQCPHCRQPIAIIAVLVPPTAAHVRTPEVSMPAG